MIVVCPICKTELATKAPGRVQRDINAALEEYKNVTDKSEESPILAFQQWLSLFTQTFGKLSLREYGIAMTAFYAAHPGKGPQSSIVAKITKETHE